MEINIDKDIFKKHNVKLAYLFGSQTKGTSGETSDFDIAILFKNPSCPLALKEITIILQELAKFFPSKIDIVSLNCASSLLKYEVVTHGRLLYCENEDERIKFEVLATKEYIDDQFFRNIYTQAMISRINQRTIQ